MSLLHEPIGSINIMMELDEPLSSAGLSADSSPEAELAVAAGEAAEQRANQLMCTSKLQGQNEVMPLTWDDISIEGMLGVGGFACVCLATAPKLWKKQHNPTKQQQQQQQQRGGGAPWENSSFASDDGISIGTLSWAGDSFVSMQSIDTSDDQTHLTDVSKYYALKSLHRRTTSSAKNFKTGACDLAAEAFLLSRLSHDNIIRMYGVTSGSVAAAFQKPGSYFLVLEALNSTLHDLIKRWRDESSQSPIRDFFKRSNHGGTVPPVGERVSKIAIGITKGMEYLHENNIIFRDLKPRNVGFCRDGNVRLFDFGLAREVQPVESKPLTQKGVAGSLKYMAPETMVLHICTPASDVFAFAILLWEVCTLQEPYETIKKPGQFKKNVAIGNVRPNIRHLNHLPNIATLIQECWARDGKERPTFVQVREKLEAFGKEDEISTIVSNKDDTSAASRPRRRSSSFGRRNKRTDESSTIANIKDDISAASSGPFRRVSSFGRRNKRGGLSTSNHSNSSFGRRNKRAGLSPSNHSNQNAIFWSRSSPSNHSSRMGSILHFRSTTSKDGSVDALKDASIQSQESATNRASQSASSYQEMLNDMVLDMVL
jgi:serine/threonine protein kinase